jgi:predicted ATPase/DNA-binding XRE family transcriptional regulator
VVHASSSAGTGQFALLLRRYRLDAGLTQGALAEQAGVSARTIQHLEAGMSQPQAETTLRLSAALGLEAEARANFLAAGRPAPRRGVRLEDDYTCATDDGADTASLPVPLTSFIGREKERDLVLQLLDGSRLVTLLGLGGLGKTRLALVVAAARIASGSMSATFVDFAPLRDGGLVAQALLNALGLDERGGQPVLARVATYLGSRAHLFVFDNCEHVVQAAAELADGLLRVCAGAQVLATSREVLGVPSEAVWRVRPLTIPPRNTDLAIGSLGELESVRLFVERARLAQHDFVLNETNVGWVRHICERLDGIPLALELAAARLRLLPLKQIAAGMDSQLRLLGGGNRLSATRQHTLRATFNWSYGLLTGAEQTFFRRLAVFADSFTLKAAESVCSGEGVATEAVLDYLAALVDKSLVLPGSDQHEGRYRLLAPVREYAAEQLAAALETIAIERRHRDYFVDFAERARRELVGSDQLLWFNRLEADWDNLRVALEWSRDEPDGAEAELRLAASLGYFWFVRGPANEGEHWLKHALARCRPEPRPALAAALVWSGQLANFRGDPQAGRQLAEQGLSVARQIGSASMIARALGVVGLALDELGDSDAALTTFREALEVAQGLGDRRRMGNALHFLARATEDAGDLHTARNMYLDALDALRGSGDHLRSGEATFDLGRLALVAGDYEAARILFEEALQLARPHAWSMFMAVVLAGLAEVARRQYNVALAHAYAYEALEWSLKSGDRVGMAAALLVAAHLLRGHGQAALAVRIYAAESDWRARGTVSAQGGPLRWVVPGLMGYEADLQALRASLSEAEFTTAWTEGSRFTLEAAIAEARTSLRSAPR